MDIVPFRSKNRLRRYRRLMGYTQREVAFFLGCKNPIRVSRWEKGDAEPSMVNLLKLSILYRTLPHELYFDLYQTLRRELSEKEEQLFQSVQEKPPYEDDS
jgi:transcriptional regulator with XRE-family HTH domain